MNRTRSKRAGLFLIFVIVAMFLAACGARADDEATLETRASNQPETASGSDAGDSGNEYLDSNPAAPGGVADGAVEYGGVEESEAPAPGEGSGAVEYAEYDEPRSGATPAPAATQGAGVPPDQQFVQPLQAGEIDDNAEYEAYLQYLMDFSRFSSIEVHAVDISERHIIEVVNRSGRPVLGATVTIFNGQHLVTALRTTAAGKVYFFPRAYLAASDAGSLNVTVEKGQQRESFTLTRDERDMTWQVTLNVSNPQTPVNLDVMFLLDATGSMSEEIRQLQDNILSISAQIEALPGNPNVRFGLVHYRDRGDDYITRTVDFTGDISTFQSELNRVYAGGGGDTPESLNEGLHVAINNASWRVENTVSILILVADAPPHLDYYQDYDYAEEMQIAAELGIKIFPIGVPLDPYSRSYHEPQAEYIFRQLAQFTGGHLIMLLSEDTPQSSGDPGSVYSVPEDRYSVEELDALVVRLVREELEALTGDGQ